MMKEISEFHFPFLAPLCIRSDSGDSTHYKVFGANYDKSPQSTYLIILGFVVGSIVQMFPGIPMGSQLFIYIATLVVGFGAIRLLSVKEMRGL